MSASGAVSVPTITSDREGFVKLFDAAANIIESDVSRVDFSRCRFLPPPAVAILAGAVLLARRKRRVQLLTSTMDSDVGRVLSQNGFLALLEETGSRPKSNAIPIRTDTRADADSFIHYLRDEWLERGWPVKLSARLQDEIISRVIEGYVNAFDHAASPVGTVTVGQYFPNLRKLQISLVDFGIGIPTSVRHHFAEPEAARIPAYNAMKWAFQRGTSTKSGDLGRGLGLDLLREFIKANDGRLEVYSNEGYVEIKQGLDVFQNWPGDFRGTLLNIEIQCDERAYVLSDERPHGKLF